jgi:hypothetical protein
MRRARRSRRTVLKEIGEKAAVSVTHNGGKTVAHVGCQLRVGGEIGEDDGAKEDAAAVVVFPLSRFFACRQGGNLFRELAFPLFQIG